MLLVLYRSWVLSIQAIVPILFHISIKSRIGVLVSTDLKTPYVSRNLIYHGNNCSLLLIVKQILRLINDSLIIFNVLLFLLCILYITHKIYIFQICTEQYYDPDLDILCEYRSMCFIENPLNCLPNRLSTPKWRLIIYQNN